jgi:ADP-heptose:LPS heptosyltransferase
MKLTDLRPECIHFTGYRPCRYDSQCQGCEHFVAAGPDILILKLYQLGNIVKSTPVLRALQRQYPGCRISWMASPSGSQLLANNPNLHQLLTDSAQDLLYAQQVHWDVVLSLEANRQAAAMAASLQAHRKLGFGLSPQGKLWPLGPESEELYSYNLNNELRFQQNQKTVHELYFELLGVPYEGEEYMLYPAASDYAYADHLIRSLGLTDGPVVGLNTGGNAARFETKQWTIDGFVQLARMLHQRLGARVVLLGGPAEVARNAEILSRTRDCAADSGCDHTILQFCAFLSRLNCVVSGDAFGLQAAVAMKTPVVGIFGPTPPQEIAIFGRGRKVVAPVSCGPCYIRNAVDCPRGADCMELITPEVVFEATVAALQGE